MMVVFVVEAEAERQINIDRVREIETSNTLILSQLISCCPVTDMISSTYTVAHGMVIADLADKVVAIILYTAPHQSQPQWQVLPSQVP
jgi:hypothetical protein